MKYRKVTFDRVKQILNDADKPLCGWEIYQSFRQDRVILKTVHAVIYKLWQYGHLTRVKINAHEITGRKEWVYQYALI